MYGKVVHFSFIYQQKSQQWHICNSEGEITTQIICLKKLVTYNVVNTKPSWILCSFVNFCIPYDFQYEDDLLLTK